MVQDYDNINGLVQERRNSIANALELHLSWTKPPNDEEDGIGGCLMVHLVVGCVTA